MSEEDDGVSPVIAVVVLVAVVVALVSLVTVTVFNTSSDIPTQPDATVQLTETENGVEATVLRNENVQSLRLEHPNGSTSLTEAVGSSAELQEGNGLYKIIATVNDEEHVIRSVNVQSASVNTVSSDTIKGSVERNPPVPNATVKVFDQSDSLVKQTSTDSNGDYRLTLSSEGEYEVVVAVNDEKLTIDGSETTFYAGDTKSVETGSTADFNFKQGNEVTCTVDGEQATVNFGVTANSYQVTTPLQTYCIDDMGIDGNYSLAPTVTDTTGNGLSDYRQENILGTDPTVTDTSGDGLSDAEQVHNLGTDPAVNDTSGDGFPDKIATETSELSPTKHNVLVEVSYMEGTTVPEFDDIKSKFDEAPVSNQYGENGVNLEVVVDDSPVTKQDDITLSQYINNYYDDNTVYQKKNDGYYHMLIVHEVVTSSGNDVPVGVTSPSIKGMLVQDSQPESQSGTQYTDDQIQGIFMHELGHQLGLLPSDFNGVDSLDYDCSNYNSVMNYDFGCFDVNTGYSTGNPYDDWSTVDGTMQDSNPIQTSIQYSE